MRLVAAPVSVRNEAVQLFKGVPMPTIRFNGKTYNSLEEMPANERQAFEHLSNLFVDKNGNGIPDFLEGDMVKNVLTAFTSNVNFNGQTYNNVNELPPEVREKVQRAMDKLAQMGMVQPGQPMIMQAPAPQIEQTPLRSSEPMISRNYSPAIEEDSGSGLKWIFLGAALLVCAVVGLAAAYLLLSR
jgi:hypothetical protein